MNKYLNDYILYRKPEQDDLNARVFTLIGSSRANPDSMLPRYNILFDSIKGIQESYTTANPSPFSWMLTNERMSDYYGQLCTAYWYKTMKDSLWQKVKQHKSYLLSNSGVAFYNYMAIHVRFLPGSKVTPPQPETAEARLIREFDNSIRKLDSVFPTAEADFLKLRLDISTDANDQKTGAERILASMRTSWCIAAERKQYQQLVAKVDDINRSLARTASGPTYAALGNPVIQTAFGASLYTASGKAMDLLAKLKQSFPGKAIIIDRWATWCGPCLAEMPHSKELQESSKDMPVVFVYLCTINGSTEDKWKAKVAELKQPGIHILIDNALDADLTNYFSFNGYPGYALIGKDGSYQPGALHWMSEIGGRDALAALINR
jgi:thiol-disulfide isomerase/thioredoxin